MWVLLTPWQPFTLFIVSDEEEKNIYIKNCLMFYLIDNKERETQASVSFLSVHSYQESRQIDQSQSAT